MVVASDPVKNYPEICDNACAPCQLNLLNFMGPLFGPVHATVCSGWMPTDHTWLRNILAWNVVIATIHHKKAKPDGLGVVEHRDQKMYEADRKEEIKHGIICVKTSMLELWKD